MPQFTRGPWAVVKRYPVPEFKIIAGDLGEPIQGIGAFENEADAHLAAAAPDLHAFVQKCIRPLANFADISALEKEAALLIAKAEGQS